MTLFLPWRKYTSSVSAYSSLIFVSFSSGNFLEQNKLLLLLPSTIVIDARRRPRAPLLFGRPKDQCSRSCNGVIGVVTRPLEYTRRLFPMRLESNAREPREHNGWMRLRIGGGVLSGVQRGETFLPGENHVTRK